jgi:hypothetical protein
MQHLRSTWVRKSAGESTARTASVDGLEVPHAARVQQQAAQLLRVGRYVVVASTRHLAHVTEHLLVPRRDGRDHLVRVRVRVSVRFRVGGLGLGLGSVVGVGPRPPAGT